MDSLWGSKTTTDKGKKLEDFISQEGLCIFNDGTDTYLHPRNGSYSAIELSVTDPFLLIRLKVFDLPLLVNNYCCCKDSMRNVKLCQHCPMDVV
jgi:hypothetical protein